VNYLFGWTSTMLPMAGLLNVNLLRVSLVLTFNILFLFILTNYLGLIGSVIAVSLTFVFQTFLSVYFVNTKLNIDILNIAHLSIKEVKSLMVKGK
jgi:hypothetical protein